MSAAEQFNPYGLHAIHIPLGMVDYPGLDWSAKCLYARLALHLGKPRKGAHCDPDRETLAREMGVSTDSIDRWLKELITEEFIKRKRHGQERAECIFLPHPCLVNTATLRHQEAEPIPQPCGVGPEPESDSNTATVPLQYRNPAVAIPQTGTLPIRKKTFRKHSEDLQEAALVSSGSFFSNEGISSSSSLEGSELVKGGADTDDSDDDESPFSERKPKNEDREALIDYARDALRASVASIKAAHEYITQTEALKTTKAPDKTITADILAAFQSFEDFEVWIADTENRALANKAKDPHAVYALYRTDARTRAEGIADDRLKEQARFAEKMAEQERLKQERETREQTLNTPVAPDTAIVTADAEVDRLNGPENSMNLNRRRYRAVPGVLKRRLARLGQPITPAAVIEMTREYCPHLLCDRTGMMGYALDRTLRFCDCLEGQELQHEDPERPAREIERVHTSLKYKLVATAVMVAGPYIADAIEASEITETPSELVFDAPKAYRLYFKDPCFAKVLEAVGELRTIRLAEMTASEKVAR